MSTTNLTGRENLTKYADKENQVKMYKKYSTVLGTLPI
jgi:hypothetical protein